MGILLTATSCAVLFPDRTAPKSSDYRVASPAAPWHKLVVDKEGATVEAMKADLAYENPETGSIISLNSLCRKYTDESLEDLTNNLVRGIGKRQQLRRTETKVDGADALDSLFEGEMDNVRLNIRTVVLKKNECTYDFIYVSIPKREGASAQAFESFLASFRTE